MAKTVSTGYWMSFLLLFFSVSLALLVFELEGIFLTPHPTQAKVAQIPIRARVN